MLVLSDNGLTPEVLTNPHVQLVVAPGVELRAVSGADDYTLVQTKNLDGSVTYALFNYGYKLMAPSVTASLSGGKLTATATSSTQGATFTYQWYLDGAPIPGRHRRHLHPHAEGQLLCGGTGRRHHSRHRCRAFPHRKERRRGL